MSSGKLQQLPYTKTTLPQGRGDGEHCMHAFSAQKKWRQLWVGILPWQVPGSWWQQGNLGNLIPSLFLRLLLPPIPKHKYMEEEADFSCTDTLDARQREACGMHSPMDLVSQKDWPGLSRGLINSGSSGLENIHFMHWSAWPRVKRGPGKP